MPTCLCLDGSAAIIDDMEPPENPESQEAIAYRLELVRTALNGGNKSAMAHSIGVTSQSWTEYTGGDDWPKSRARIALDPAMRLCRRYGVTLDWLYQGRGYGVPPEVMGKLDKTASQWASKSRPRRKKL